MFNSSLGGLLYWLGERPLVLGSPSVSSVDLGLLGTHLRSYSTFPHPNALAGFLLITLSLLFSFKKLFISGKFATMFRASAALAILGLFTTHSLSAISLFLIVLAFTYLPGPGISKLKLILASVILASTFLAVFSLRPTSVFDRLEQLKSALSVISQFPLFGTGFGAYILGDTTPISKYGSFYQPVHNVYLLLLSEFGLLGFSSILIYLIHLIKRSVGIFQHQISLPLILILLLGLTDHYWLTSHSNYIFAVLLLVFLSKQHAQSKLVR
jgi:O-antigen ligase